MKTKFIKNVFARIKEYNKTNTKLDEKYLTEDFWNTLFAHVNELIVCDMMHEEEHLHLGLIEFIDTFMGIANKRKLKDKHVENFIETIEFLENSYFLNHDAFSKVEGFEKYFSENTLYRREDFAKICVDKYTNLLISKIIDYLPDDEKKDKAFNNFISSFVDMKNRLYNLADNDLVYWVYPFTESNRYIPVSLHHLNNFNNLGDKIEEWSDNDTRIGKLMRDNGFDVFSGWANIGLATLKSNKKTKKQDTEKELTVEKPILPRHLVERLVDAIIASCAVYARNPRFNISNTTFYNILMRSIVVNLRTYSDTYKINDEVISLFMTSCHRIVRKMKAFKRRADFKLWFVQTDVKRIATYLDTFNNNYYDYLLANVVLHAFDSATNNNMTKERWDQHHTVISNTYHCLYNRSTGVDKEELIRILQFYRDFYVPVYRSLIDAIRFPIFDFSINFFLNIREEDQVIECIGELERFVGRRQTKEDIKEYYESRYPFYRLMSYGNKRLFLPKLKALIDSGNYVSYNGSAKLLDNIYQLVDLDLINQKATLKGMSDDTDPDDEETILFVKETENVQYAVKEEEI